MKTIYALCIADEDPELFHDEGDGKGREKALEAGRQAIRELYDPASLQFSEKVVSVIVVQLIAHAEERDRVDRPPPEELDAEGFDREGIDWSDGQDFICDYGLNVLQDEPVVQSARVFH
jgi:hypothetical protein